MLVVPFGLQRNLKYNFVLIFSLSQMNAVKLVMIVHCLSVSSALIQVCWLLLPGKIQFRSFLQSLTKKKKK